MVSSTITCITGRFFNFYRTKKLLGWSAVSQVALTLIFHYESPIPSFSHAQVMFWSFHSRFVLMSVMCSLAESQARIKQGSGIFNGIEVH